MATSLAILPQRQPALAQRPKLQINTQTVRTFGKGSSLRLETLSAISPTDRNTFTNTYEAPASAAPILGIPKPRLSIVSSNLPPHPTTADTSNTSTPISASTPASTLTSATSTESATISIPYKQPHNLKSVLANSPARHLLPRKMAPARPMFSVSKRVSFRTPLEEEIKTVKYTMAHSDIESSTGSLSSVISSSESDSLSSSTLSLLSTASDTNGPSSPSISSPTEQSTSSAFSSLEGSPGLRSPRTGEKRDSSSSESDSDEDACPETPVAGRRKRRREWRWTLGPLDKSSPSNDTTTSEDSN